MCGVVVRRSAVSERRDGEGEDDIDSDEVGSLATAAAAAVPPRWVEWPLPPLRAGPAGYRADG